MCDSLANTAHFKWIAGVITKARSLITKALLRQSQHKDVGFKNAPTEISYVAFIDVLGFGNEVMTSFDAATEKYDIFIETLSSVLKSSGIFNITVRMISDSVYLTSKNCRDIYAASQWVQILALQNCSWLVRGAIAAGRHQEMTANGNIFVVSRPLVDSVRMEKESKSPFIKIHSSALDIRYTMSKNPSNLERLILYYDGGWIINPFNMYWAASAKDRVEELKEQYPGYSAIYDAFLRLHEESVSGALFLPQDFKEQVASAMGEWERKRGV